jgi:rhomboid protease GluP
MIFSGVHPVHPDAIDLLHWGGIRRFEVHDGEWWRLVTSQFIHSGFYHLFLNLVGLVLAGILIEPLLGRTRTMILYLASGICAGLSSIYWHENTVGIGASGAIFGLYGGIFAIYLLANRRKRFEIYDKSIITFLVFYIGTNLVLGFFGGADNAAHFGGLLSGAVISLIIFQKNSGDE